MSQLCAYINRINIPKSGVLLEVAGLGEAVEWSRLETERSSKLVMASF